MTTANAYLVVFVRSGRELLVWASMCCFCHEVCRRKSVLSWQDFCAALSWSQPRTPDKGCTGFTLKHMGSYGPSKFGGFGSLGFGFRNSECFHVFMQWYLFEVPSQRDVMSCHVIRHFCTAYKTCLIQLHFWDTFIAGYGVISYEALLRYTGPRPQRRAERSSRGP